jgi:hypothetical protein
MWKPPVKINTPSYASITDSRWPPTFNLEKLKKINRQKLATKLRMVQYLKQLTTFVLYFLNYLCLLFGFFVMLMVLKKDLNPAYVLNIKEAMMFVSVTTFCYFLAFLARYFLSVMEYKITLIRSKLAELS